MANEAIYPSCVVNLRLRFDESFQVVELPAAGPQDGDPLSAILPAITLGRSRSTPNGGSGFTGGNRPLITQTGSDNLSFVMDRVPKTAQVELPGYRQAGKFTLEFDWRELPIDPRLVRSAAVEIFFGTVSPDDFSTGMTRVEANGRRRSILRTADDGGVPRDDLMTLCGVADTWFISQTGESSMVKIEGRDLRGIFLDSPVNEEMATKLDLTQSLDLVILEILASHPAAAYMTIIYAAEDWPGGVPPSVLDKDGLTRVRRKAQGDGASASTQDDKLSMWDLITRYCFLVGAIPYFRGRSLVLRPALSVFDQSKPKFSSSDKVFDPVTRVDDEGSAFTTRKMVFGRNIKELTFERKLSGVKVPTIEVVSFDTSSKTRGAGKLLIAQWPPADQTAAKMTNVSPSGEVAQEDKLVISVPGVRNLDKLTGVARSIWEEVGRGELGGSCKTGQVASFKGGNEDPDLLRLRPGDVVEFLTDTRQVSDKVPGASTYVDGLRVSFDQQVEEVRTALSGKAGHGDENLARVIVASARSAVVDLLRSFRTANVIFTWSIASGVAVAFDFQNYFVVRYGIQEQLGANTKPGVNQTVNSSTAKRGKVKVISRAVVSANAGKGANTHVGSLKSPKGKGTK